ncbi:hypothetical protein RHMOL_Rhmol01G0041900 [Rhododendron molle]|uniref:Uncharacterized protein n=1 Tax=Rhododendron molle TaxID=49168 RepID=A0ACC0PY94_RHOML|nr:hypothetical protein RHMOL_Rhmol01G0041900 [Rhododendron molle]
MRPSERSSEKGLTNSVGGTSSRTKTLPGRVMTLKSVNNEAMSTKNAVSDLMDGIPPEYADQLQNPEELVKRLNLDVPPECMPEVAAALAKHYNQRHLVRLTP